MVRRPEAKSAAGVVLLVGGTLLALYPIVIVPLRDGTDATRAGAQAGVTSPGFSKGGMWRELDKQRAEGAAGGPAKDA